MITEPPRSMGVGAEGGRGGGGGGGYRHAWLHLCTLLCKLCHDVFPNAPGAARDEGDLVLEAKSRQEVLRHVGLRGRHSRSEGASPLQSQVRSSSCASIDVLLCQSGVHACAHVHSSRDVHYSGGQQQNSWSA